jgi:hypothetical protein
MGLNANEENEFYQLLVINGSSQDLTLMVTCFITAVKYDQEMYGIKSLDLQWKNVPMSPNNYF